MLAQKKNAVWRRRWLRGAREGVGNKAHATRNGLGNERSCTYRTGIRILIYKKAYPVIPSLTHPLSVCLSLSLSLSPGLSRSHFLFSDFVPSLPRRGRPIQFRVVCTTTIIINTSERAGACVCERRASRRVWYELLRRTQSRQAVRRESLINLEIKNKNFSRPE